MGNCKEVYKLWEMVRKRHPETGVEDDEHTVSQIYTGLGLHVEGKNITVDQAIQIAEWARYLFQTPQKLREDLAVRELILNGKKVDLSIDRWPACEPPEELRDNIPTWPLNLTIGIINLIKR